MRVRKRPLGETNDSSEGVTSFSACPGALAESGKEKIHCSEMSHDVSATVCQDVGDTEDSWKKVLWSDESKIYFWLSY